MTDKELKELIEDCCNEIANKIEPLANVKSRLYTSLKAAISVTRCCEEVKDDLQFERKSSARVFNNQTGMWEFI